LAITNPPGSAVSLR